MKKFKLPTAYTIVVIVLIFTAALSYFVPQSVVHPETGEIVFNAIFSGEGDILQGKVYSPLVYGIYSLRLLKVSKLPLTSGLEF